MDVLHQSASGCLQLVKFYKDLELRVCSLRKVAELSKEAEALAGQIEQLESDVRAYPFRGRFFFAC